MRCPLKAVQEVALPILYSCLEFENIVALERFISVVEAAAAEGRDLACHLRSLTTPPIVTLASRMAWREYSITVARLAALLVRVDRLRFLEAGGICGLTATPILARTCPNTLQHLRLTLSNIPIQSALLHLHEFRTLRTLKLVLNEGRDSLPALNIPAWSFPCLIELSLFTRPDVDLSKRMIEFLYTCQLGSLRRLGITATIGNADVAESFASLCLKLRMLEGLQLEIDSRWYPQVIPCLKTRILHVVDPGTSLAAYLPSTVQCLYISSNSFSLEFYTNLHAIFDQILAQRKGIEDVHMPARFAWARKARSDGSAYSPAPNEDVNLPHLLQYALRFQTSGICLRDGRGNTLMDYLQRS
jgi:hypothetical protein